MGKSVQAPASPDYAAAATAQGQANTDAAKQSLAYSNPNVFTPYGKQTMGFTYNPLTGQDDYPEIFQTLTPNGQAAVDQQQETQLALSRVANQQTNSIGDLLSRPFQYSGSPQTSVQNAGPIQGGVNANQYNIQGGGIPLNLQNSVDTQGLMPINGAPGGQAYGWAAGVNGGPQLQNSLDESGVAKAPVNAGMTAQDAIMSRLQPQLAQNRTSTETNLINQGLRPGSEAYDNSIRNLGQQENDQRTQAALQGLNLDMAANQQGFGQAQARGQFGNDAGLAGYNAQLANQQLNNQAIGQNFGQGLASSQAGNQAQQQQFGQRVQAGEFGNNAQLASFGAGLQNQGAANSATTQNFQNQLAGLGANNSAQQQQYGQNLGNAQFGNTAQQQQLAQEMALRNLPINEITALLSGGQVQNPQFQGYQGTSVTPSPTFQGVQAQGAWDQNQYNQQVAQRNAMMSGLFGLGGVATGGLFGLGG